MYSLKIESLSVFYLTSKYKQEECSASELKCIHLYLPRSEQEGLCVCHPVDLGRK